VISRLAVASLVQHRSRTLLAVLGVAVSSAMLLDMVMLATGMRTSFRTLLLSRGFQLRLAPKGTLPFDTEATIGNASRVRATLLANPDIVAVSPVLGGQLHVVSRGRAIATIALGVDPRVQGDYELTAGRDLDTPGSMVANETFMRATGARIGDTLQVAAGYDPELRSVAGARRVVLAGRARFLYMPVDTRAVAVPLAFLQGIGGAGTPAEPGRTDRASLFMVKARLGGGAEVERVRQWIERTIPSASAISIETAMRQVDERLTYFRQLAVILGVISLGVGFLLVTTLVTVSVNERMGEIAVMRALGVARVHVVQQIVLEGAAITLSGAVLGLALGLVTARYLNSILAGFPGLPAAIDFFLFEPRDAWTALGLLVVCGVLAGVYPSWRGATLPIASTLREEVVG
jgi:ABC-type lipoprotein release transport system permease subunit